MRLDGKPWTLTMLPIAGSLMFSGCAPTNAPTPGNIVSHCAPRFVSTSGIRRIIAAVSDDGDGSGVTADIMDAELAKFGGVTAYFPDAKLNLPQTAHAAKLRQPFLLLRAATITDNTGHGKRDTYLLVQSATGQFFWHVFLSADNEDVCKWLPL